MLIRSSNAFALCAALVFAMASVSHANPFVRSIGPAQVVAVESARSTDLVVLHNGFSAGFRQGMVCHVTRDGAAIAEILLVDLRSHATTALILNLAPGQRIQPGDIAAVKMRQI